jgi:hypothetical protein
LIGFGLISIQSGGQLETSIQKSTHFAGRVDFQKRLDLWTEMIFLVQFAGMQILDKAFELARNSVSSSCVKEIGSSLILVK